MMGKYTNRGSQSDHSTLFKKNSWLLIHKEDVPLPPATSHPEAKGAFGRVSDTGMCPLPMAKKLAGAGSQRRSCCRGVGQLELAYGREGREAPAAESPQGEFRVLLSSLEQRHKVIFYPTILNHDLVQKTQFLTLVYTLFRLDLLFHLIIWISKKQPRVTQSISKMRFSWTLRAPRRLAAWGAVGRGSSSWAYPLNLSLKPRFPWLPSELTAAPPWLTSLHF